MQQAATVKPKKPATKGETLIGLVVLVGVVWAVGAWCSSLSSVTKNTAPVPLTLNAFPALKQLLSGQNNDTPAKPKLRDFSYYPDTGQVNVDFNMDLNLTTDMTRGGLQMEMSKLYIALYHGDGPAIKNASMHAWGPVSDKYGNANYAQLIGTTLAAAEAQRVNWNTDSATLQLAVLPGIWKTFLGNANLGWPQSRN